MNEDQKDIRIRDLEERLDVLTARILPLERDITALKLRALSGAVLIETEEQWKACFGDRGVPCPVGMLPIIGFVNKEPK